MKKFQGSGSGSKTGGMNKLLAKIAMGVKLKLRNYEVNVDRFNKFKQSKEDKIDLGENLL